MAMTIRSVRRAAVPTRIALIGDSTLADIGDTAMRAALVAAGWNTSKVSFYAVASKAIAYSDTNGKTTLQNMTDARTALGAEPDVWYFNLGSNGHHDDIGGGIAATQATWMNAVLNNVVAGAQVIWNGISQVDGYDGGTSNVATRQAWNAIAQPIVEARSFARWADWNGYLKSYPGGDATLWDGTGIHHTTAGDLVKKNYIVTQVGPGGG